MIGNYYSVIDNSTREVLLGRSKREFDFCSIIWDANLSLYSDYILKKSNRVIEESDISLYRGRTREEDFSNLIPEIDEYREKYGNNVIDSYIENILLQGDLTK